MKQLLLFFVFLSSLQAEKIALIPQAQQIKVLKGQFSLDYDTTIKASLGLEKEASLLRSYLQPATFYQLPFDIAAQKNVIELQLVPAISKNREEAYSLTVRPQKVLIRASHAKGIFYGIQTLRQLLPAKIFETEKQSCNIQWNIPAVEITDRPTYAWRGFMLDDSRQFFGKEYIKKTLDRMAMHKLNTFHWHLTDDDGWRIEIKKYPKLTELGAFRGPGCLIPGRYGHENERYGGFYTQEDIKEIVAYAAERHIIVIPEIDLPAHAKILTLCYPELVVDPQDQSDYVSVQGLKGNTINPALETTYQFLDDVFTEIAPLFNSPYIHVGGDERPRGAWQGSPAVSSLMKREKLKDLTAVQHYFFQRVEKILQQKGKKMAGWQEISHGGRLHPSTLHFGWQNSTSGLDLAQKGLKTVLSPAPFTYFDLAHNNSLKEPGLRWAGTISLFKAYSYQPRSYRIRDRKAIFKNISGIQACLWAETLTEGAKSADKMLYPRLSAFSEVAWTQPHRKSWSGFYQRFHNQHTLRLDALKIPYHINTPTLHMKKGLFSLKPQSPHHQVRYTLDATEPNSDSPLFDKAISLKRGEQLKAKSFSPHSESFSQQAIQAVNFASWSPKDINANSQEWNIPCDKVFFASGIYKFYFLYSHGDHRLDIQSLKILEDGVVISQDKHHGFTGSRRSANLYILRINKFDPNKRYQLRARVFGDGGNLSHGQVSLYYQPLTCPPSRVKSSLKAHGNYKLSRITDSNPKTFFWSNHNIKKGDFITVHFDKKTPISTIQWKTGDNTAKDQLRSGILEASKDGIKFFKISRFQNGQATHSFSVPTKIKALRLKATADQNSWIISKDLTAQ